MAIYEKVDQSIVDKILCITDQLAFLKSRQELTLYSGYNSDIGILVGDYIAAIIVT